MQLTYYRDAGAFLGRALAWLEQNEAANNLIVGIALRVHEFPERFTSGAYLAVIDAEGVPVAAAVMTPPFRVILHSDLGEETAPLGLILDDIQARGWPLPGVTGPSVPARAFARIWAQRTGGTIEPGMSERVYELRHVYPPEGIPGRLRLAEPDDVPLAAVWIEGFNRDARLDTVAGSPREIAEQRIGDRAWYFWEVDGRPVSMAGSGRRTTHGAMIGPVYTPPEERNRGYASACVAALSQRLLDSGREFCALFTDLANPTSNSIYQRIGYRPVCDFNEYRFKEPRS